MSAEPLAVAVPAPAGRTELERSPAFRAYATPAGRRARLPPGAPRASGRRRLSGGLQRRRRPVRRPGLSYAWTWQNAMTDQREQITDAPRPAEDEVDVRGHRPVDRAPADHETAAEAPPELTADRARAARRPLRDRRGARRRGRPARRPPPGRQGVRLRLRAPRRPAPPVRRGLHRPPGRRGEDLRGDAARHRHAGRGPPPRHRRGHERGPRRGARGVRRGGLRPGRRRHEAHRHHVPVARRGAGRELPQDDGRDGHGHPGHPHQARRPAAQHAHARRDAEAEADREGEGDARDLRAAGAPARHPRDQVGARGPQRSRRCTRASTRRSRASSASSATSASATWRRPAAT